MRALCVALLLLLLPGAGSGRRARQPSYDMLVAQLKVGQHGDRLSGAALRPRRAAGLQSLRRAGRSRQGRSDPRDGGERSRHGRRRSRTRSSRATTPTSTPMRRSPPSFERRGERDEAAFELAVANGLLALDPQVGRRHDARDRLCRDRRRGGIQPPRRDGRAGGEANRSSRPRAVRSMRSKWSIPQTASAAPSISTSAGCSTRWPASAARRRRRNYGFSSNALAEGICPLPVIGGRLGDLAYVRLRPDPGRSRLSQPMSASLIGRWGSSAFRLSTTPASMSLTGSRFSSESARRPFQHGVRGRGGTIFWAALPAD